MFFIAIVGGDKLLMARVEISGPGIGSNGGRARQVS
jgi:hypothetical protein